ncbi:hypothetical protein [Desulfonema magnum]|uniref:hypothetical protein n=1 Tax=Desulfonema magnum TaxID=45655 RepID=UPI001A9BA1B6|nr:hypothetical protein [Desulfonema magnum]
MPQRHTKKSSWDFVPLCLRGILEELATKTYKEIFVGLRAFVPSWHFISWTLPYNQ